MKTFFAHLATRFLISVAACLSLTAVFADDTNGSNSRAPHFYSKSPWAVGFGMEGTVTNVALIDERFQFHLNGRFWFSQYPPQSTKQQVIEVHHERGFSATVSPDSFVAMTKDWRAGSVQNEKGKLLKILKTAAERGTVVKFALMLVNSSSPISRRQAGGLATYSAAYPTVVRTKGFGAFVFQTPTTRFTRCLLPGRQHPTVLL